MHKGILPPVRFPGTRVLCQTANLDGGGARILLSQAARSHYGAPSCKDCKTKSCCADLSGIMRSGDRRRKHV